MKTTCFKCGISFEKPDKEWRRSEKLGRRHFCGRGCSASAGNSEHPRGNANHLNPANRRDDYSPFRAHLACAKRRAAKSKIEFSLTLENLKAQWETQNGTCPYTGWRLTNPPTSDLFHRATRTPNRASLDRKNCKTGYTAANIQFVAMIANFAKNDFSDQQLHDFCKAVTNHIP